MVISFLAMAQFMLGNRTEAEATFSRIKNQSIDNITLSKQTSTQFIREAANLLYPQTPPIDPFQP